MTASWDSLVHRTTATAVGLTLLSLATCSPYELAYDAAEEVVSWFADTDRVEASFTVAGGDLREAAIQSVLLEQFGVEAVFDTIETGVTVIRLIGLYGEVLEATEWLIARGIELLANEEVAAAILRVVITAAK